MNLDKTISYALSLSGGGYKGAYQAGALEALHDEGYKFSAIVGTSVGALNGAIAIQNDFTRLREMWSNPESKKVFDFDNDEIDKALNLDLKDLNILELGKEIFDLVQDGGLEVAPLLEMIDANVDEEKLRRDKVEFGLVTINLSDKKVEEIMLSDMPVGQLRDYLLATSYLPVFERIKLHGKYYLDGGYYNNTPTNMLVERGYKNIIELRLNNKEKIEKYDANIIRLIPSVDLGSSIVYDEKQITDNYKLGYEEGLKLARNEKKDYILKKVW